jgi:hypothetical protein
MLREYHSTSRISYSEYYSIEIGENKNYFPLLFLIAVHHVKVVGATPWTDIRRHRQGIMPNMATVTPSPTYGDRSIISCEITDHSPELTISLGPAKSFIGFPSIQLAGHPEISFQFFTSRCSRKLETGDCL